MIISYGISYLSPILSHLPGTTTSKSPALMHSSEIFNSLAAAIVPKAL